MDDADQVGQPLCGRAGEERRGLDRLHAHRPGDAAVPGVGRHGAVPVAAHHQHPPGVRARHRPTAGVVGRLQPRRFDHQTRTARLITKRAHACASSRHC